MRHIIELKNVSFRYSEEEPLAVEDISLSIQKGEWIAIIGHNGSGKSTLSKLLNGLLEAETGEIWVDSMLLTKDSVWDIRRKIGMVFQNPDNQFVGTTVEDDIAFGMENLGIEREEMIQRMNDVLQRVRMEDFRKKEPARLSGGQKQRVAIASILALHPAVIVLDEATAMLDPKGRMEVIETIRQLNKQEGMTVISITHDLQEAAEADRVFLMNEGKLELTATPEHLFSMGEELVQKGLDSPFSQKLKQLLQEKGLEVPKEYMSEERLVEWIWTSVLKT